MNLLIKYKYLFFILIAFILYGNTIQNSYSIDDDFVTNRSFTTKGFSSIKKIFTTPYSLNEEGKGFEYRPIVKLSFALEHGFFGVKTQTSHIINILLYALSLILLYKILTVIFGEEKKDFVFFTVLVFAFMPAHTEVVASLKNRDILLCYIFSMLSFLQFNNFLKTKKLYFICLGIVLMITAFLSKFDAFPLLALFPIFLFKKTDYSVKNILITIIIILIIYFGRGLLEDTLVEQSTMRSDYFYYENPLNFYNPSYLKFAALLNSLGFYIKLLVFPFTLSCYYGYNTISVDNYFTNETFIGLIAIVALLVLLVKNFKNIKHPLFIGTLFFGCSISMYLNFIIPAPGIVADRFVFFASTGFAIILTYIIFLTQKKFFVFGKQKITLPFFILFTILCFELPIILIRNKEWKDILTLVSNDVKKHPNSMKLNVLYANELISEVKKGRLPPAKFIQNITLAKNHLLKAYHIDSSYYNTCNSLGFIEMTFDKNPEKAIFWFKKSYKNYPSKFETTLNLAICFEKLNQTDSALTYFDKSYRIKPNSESLKLYFSNYLKTINKSDLIPKYYPF
jgi:hypothetical protein